jgi:hypothetical protein
MNRRHSIKREAEFIALMRATMPSRHAFILAAAWKERMKYADQIGTMLEIPFGTKQDAHGSSMKRLERLSCCCTYIISECQNSCFVHTKGGSGDQLDMELSSLKC